jgi:hypothetical protein
MAFLPKKPDRVPFLGSTGADSEMENFIYLDHAQQ